MRIALLSYEYPPDTGFGGIGTYTWYQARGLAKLGHDVHVFAGATENGTTASEHDGVRVTRFKRDGWFNRTLDGLSRHRAGWAANRLQTAYHAYHMLRSALDAEAFDIVEFPECGADGAAVATLCDVRTIVKFHSPARLIMDMYDTPKIDRELTALFEQVAINQADLRMSCSRWLADEAESAMNVTPPIHVVPNGIDLELFDRDEGIDVHQQFALPRDGVAVFFANRMEERKGIHLVRDMCVHLLQKYPHVHFVFAGGDPFGYMAQKILPFVEQQGLRGRFHYLGKLNLPEVRAVLKHIDIFLIPSLWENCPYSCIEAMSASRAIVSSDCGGMPELIEDGVNGILARSNEATSFIAGLERAIEDPALRERLGTAARNVVEDRLTDVKIAARSVEVYTSH